LRQSSLKAPTFSVNHSITGMGMEHLFFCSVTAFICGWGAVVCLYFSQVIPAVKKRRGSKTVFEAAFQLNFAGHIREYGQIAKQENNMKMLKIFYILNVLVVLSVLAFLTGLLASLF
jgi:hypothetical protein